MLEGKTANNIVDRYHRIITGDQNQIEMGIIPEGKITITENGTDIDVAQYALADVNAGITPTGTKDITENGNNIDVTNYAAVNVNVPTALNLPFASVTFDTSLTIYCGYCDITKQYPKEATATALNVYNVPCWTGYGAAGQKWGAFYFGGSLASSGKSVTAATIDNGTILVTSGYTAIGDKFQISNGSNVNAMCAFFVTTSANPQITITIA